MNPMPESSEIRITLVRVVESQGPEIPANSAPSQAWAENWEHPCRESVLPKAAFVQHRFTASMPECEVEGGLS